MKKSFLEERNPVLQRKYHQKNKHMGCPPCKLLGTLLEMDKGGTSTNGPGEKKTKDDA